MEARKAQASVDTRHVFWPILCQTTIICTINGNIPRRKYPTQTLPFKWSGYFLAHLSCGDVHLILTLSTSEMMMDTSKKNSISLLSHANNGISVVNALNRWRYLLLTLKLILIQHFLWTKHRPVIILKVNITLFCLFVCGLVLFLPNLNTLTHEWMYGIIYHFPINYFPSNALNKLNVNISLNYRNLNNERDSCGTFQSGDF